MSKKRKEEGIPLFYRAENYERVNSWRIDTAENITEERVVSIRVKTNQNEQTIIVPINFR